jgi:hypothetical protein
MISVPCWARSEKGVELDGERFRGPPLEEGLRSSARPGCGVATYGLEEGGFWLDRELGMTPPSAITGAWPRLGGGTTAERWSCMGSPNIDDT